MQFTIHNIIDKDIEFDDKIIKMDNLIYFTILKENNNILYKGSYIFLFFQEKISNVKYDNYIIILDQNKYNIIRGFRIKSELLNKKIVALDISYDGDFIIEGITINSIRFIVKLDNFIPFAHSQRFEDLYPIVIGERGLGNTKIYFPTAIRIVKNNDLVYFIIADTGNNRIVVKGYTDDNNIYELVLPNNSYITDIYFKNNIFYLTDKKNNKIYLLPYFHIFDNIKEFSEIINLDNIDPELIRSSKILKYDNNIIYILQNDAKTGIFKIDLSTKKLIDKFTGKYLTPSSLVVPPYTIDDDEQITYYLNPIKLISMINNNITIFNGVNLDFFNNYI